jgi:hypothetical protein
MQGKECGESYKMPTYRGAERAAYHQDAGRRQGKGGSRNTACSVSTGSDREICESKQPIPNSEYDAHPKPKEKTMVHARGGRKDEPDREARAWCRRPQAGRAVSSSSPCPPPGSCR